MPKIYRERMTARSESPYVVFLIGMRINNIFAIHKWLPVFMAMPKMLKELHINRELGFKSYQMWFARTTILLQYWESSEKLIAYAKSADSEHLPAWRAFNRAGKSPAVGIWHETYVIDPGKSENVYVNMPPFGFGKVGNLQPVSGRLNSAEERLKAKN
jgi:hypothetical protein